MALGNVVVFGATTVPGAELCRLLSVGGRTVVAISTGEGDISSLAPLDLEIRTVDPRKKAAVNAVMKNLSMPETVVSFVNQGGALSVIDAALAAGARRFILVTSIGGGESRKALSFLKRVFERKRLKHLTHVEDHLRALKVSWTILRAGRYAGRKPSGNGVLVESPLAYGTINNIDLARIVFDALDNVNMECKVFCAIDAKHAKMKDGTSVVVAEV